MCVLQHTLEVRGQLSGVGSEGRTQVIWLLQQVMIIDLLSHLKENVLSQAWWYRSEISGTWEAGWGKWIISSRLIWATQCVQGWWGNLNRPCLKK